LRKIPVLSLSFARHSAREICRLSTGIFRKYPSQAWYICIKDNGVERHNQLVSLFDEKASDNSDIPLGDNGNVNNTSVLNECISIYSEYEGVAFFSKSCVYNNINSNDTWLRIVCLNCCGIKRRLQYPEFRNLIELWYNLFCGEKNWRYRYNNFPRLQVCHEKQGKNYKKTFRVVSW
jgi:predicted helicase